jgi:hypothetical protein
MERNQKNDWKSIRFLLKKNNSDVFFNNGNLKGFIEDIPLDKIERVPPIIENQLTSLHQRLEKNEILIKEAQDIKETIHPKPSDDEYFLSWDTLDIPKNNERINFLKENYRNCRQ